MSIKTNASSTIMENAADKLPAPHMRFYSSAEVVPMLGLSRSAVDALCKVGALDRYKFGRSARISHDSIIRYLEASRPSKHTSNGSGQS